MSVKHKIRYDKNNRPHISHGDEIPFWCDFASQLEFLERVRKHIDDLELQVKKTRDDPEGIFHEVDGKECHAQRSFYPITNVFNLIRKLEDEMKFIYVSMANGEDEPKKTKKQIVIEHSEEKQKKLLAEIDSMKKDTSRIKAVFDDDMFLIKEAEQRFRAEQQ
jgi:hypothetical protein